MPETPTQIVTLTMRVPYERTESGQWHAEAETIDDATMRQRLTAATADSPTGFARVLAEATALAEDLPDRVPLADHPALEWLAIHLWQTVADGEGSMELHSRLSGWLAQRQATGLDVPADTGGQQIASAQPSGRPAVDIAASLAEFGASLTPQQRAEWLATLRAVEGTDCPWHETWRDCAVAGCPPPDPDERDDDGPGFDSDEWVAAIERAWGARDHDFLRQAAHDLRRELSATADELVGTERAALAELAQARRAVVGLSAGLEAARRDGAADALDWAACEWDRTAVGTNEWPTRDQLSEWAACVRAGSLTIPTTDTTEESDHDEH